MSLLISLWLVAVIAIIFASVALWATLSDPAQNRRSLKQKADMATQSTSNERARDFVSIFGCDGSSAVSIDSEGRQLVFLAPYGRESVPFHAVTGCDLFVNGCNIAAFPFADPEEALRELTLIYPTITKVEVIVRIVGSPLIRSLVTFDIERRTAPDVGLAAALRLHHLLSKHIPTTAN